MRKINSRGMAQANKHVLMSALTYNLKKLLKFERKKEVKNAQELPVVGEVLGHLQNWFFMAQLQLI